MRAKPNVLVLFTDQQRYDTVARAGYRHMITPNLDRLCDEGCTYVNAHSTNPVCMPARHDLMTGLPGRAHGYYSNTNAPIRDYAVPTLARIFSENGYPTAAYSDLRQRALEYELKWGPEDMVKDGDFVANWLKYGSGDDIIVKLFGE